MDTGATQHLLSEGTIGVAEAEAFTGLGRTFLYSLMESGQLRYVKAGKRRLIPRIELTRMLAERLIDPAE
jgi:excisionase family DNA binding protein